jgi:hypothetical protein
MFLEFKIENFYKIIIFGFINMVLKIVVFMKDLIIIFKNKIVYKVVHNFLYNKVIL